MQNVAFCYYCRCLSALTKEFTSTSVPDRKLVKCYFWSIDLYGADTWELRKVDQKFLESSEMWHCRRMEKISWSDLVKKMKYYIRVKEERNILRTISNGRLNGLVASCLGNVF
jgi:hypothetical protein